MNFLSHFYFDRFTTDPLRVMGMVLPDLLKNANKVWSIHPEKHEDQFRDPGQQSIYSGWQRHIAVDKHFHGSDFFLQHTQELRSIITPFLSSSPAKPFFVAHIALELMLDSLLLTMNSVNPTTFYIHLENANKQELSRFLEINSIPEPKVFFNFLEEFIKAQYLNSYSDAAEVVYALNRICMRLWADPFNETQKLQLKASLIEYQEQLQDTYMEIFLDIERVLN